MEEKGEGTRAHFNQAFIELKTGNIIAGGPSFAVPFTRGIWKRWGGGPLGPDNLEYRYFYRGEETRGKR